MEREDIINHGPDPDKLFFADTDLMRFLEKTPRRMMLERGAHSTWAKKLVSSPRLREGLLPFLGMGADCRERRAR